MKKEPLLNLLLSKGELHSAIMTTFSFDFYFLDDLVSRLRSKGITNTTIIADSLMVNDALGNLSSQGNFGKTYSIMGWPNDNLFHSKVHLFVGKEKAMLFIGSGNISMHGFGINAEIFNCFQFNGIEDKKNQLLYNCWSYLKSKISLFNISIQTQFEWIKKKLRG